MTALISFKVDMDPTTGEPTNNLTVEAKNGFKRELNIDINTADEAVNNAAVQKYVSQCIEKANEKSVSRAAHIRKWKLLTVDFSMPGGELTPTMKLKRKVTETKY